MKPVECQHRIVADGQPVCEIVQEITDQPLRDCHTNDSACHYCLSCGIAPQHPNPATASMAIGVATRTGDQTFSREMVKRMGPFLNRAQPPQINCVHRGKVIGQRECKPCNAGAGGLLVDVFQCPIHAQCTLQQTGSHPVIKSCAGCPDRHEKPSLLNIITNS